MSSLTRFNPYPETKDSGIEWLGQIPAHWAPSKIYGTCSVKARLGWKGLKAEEYVDEGYIFLSTPNIKNGEIDFEKVNYITEERYEESPEIMLQKGDVLLAKDGSTLGIVNVVRALPQPATVNSSIAVIRPDSSRFDSVYLCYLLASRFTQSVIERMKGGMGVPHLFQADIRKFRLLQPPLPEQQAIADFLDRETAKIDALVEKKERLIELLQEKRTALITHAVTKGLNPDAPMKDSGIEWLGQIPEHWRAKRLKHLIAEPLKYGANEAAALDDPDLPRYVRITDIDDSDALRDETFRSLPADVAEPYLLEQGDLLFARSGATAGKTFLYRENWGICAYAGYLIRARLDTDKIRPRFARYFTASAAYWKWLSSVFIQATIQNVSAEKYAELRVSVPPAAEQDAILEHLDRETAKVDVLIAKVGEAIERLKEYRTALISAAVTGKIDVRGVAFQDSDGASELSQKRK